MPMKQSYNFNNDYRFLLNESSDTMPRETKNKNNSSGNELPESEMVPKKNVLDFIMHYSKSLEVIKYKCVKPVYFIKN